MDFCFNRHGPASPRPLEQRFRLRSSYLFVSCAGCRGSQESAKGGALHVAGGATFGSMPEAVAHSVQFADGPVKLIRFRGQNLAFYARAPIRHEHACNLVERKAGGGPQRNQCQPFQSSRPCLLPVTHSWGQALPFACSARAISRLT